VYKLTIANIPINPAESVQRRRPVTVMSDDDQDNVAPPETDEDQDLESPLLAMTGRRGHKSQVSRDDEDEGYTADDGDNDDDEEEPVDISLRNLGAKELKYTLQNEVSTSYSSLTLFI
jgi:hypothetical protein